MKIKISTAAYNEIATALERLGVKADGSTELTLEKGTQLSCPIDFKMVTIRRDVATIAASSYQHREDRQQSFVPFCEDLMNWIMDENKEITTIDPTKHTKGWK